MVNSTVPPSCSSAWETRGVGKGGSTTSASPTFPRIRDSVKELIGKQTDALARYFAATLDTKVKEEIERLLKEYGKLKEPWVFVVR
jgi:hypothetical protein